MKGVLIAITFGGILFGCSTEPAEQAEAIRLGEEAAMHCTGTCLAPDFSTWDLVRKVSLPLAEQVTEARRSITTDDALRRELSEAELDSAAIDLFFSLGHLTGGEAFSADHSLAVISTITNIINRHATQGTDVVFLVDKTGSMTDDIATLRTNLHYIINVLKHLPDVRLGLAFYADHNFEANWFDLYPLTQDFGLISEALDHVHPVGGGDKPESVNDGIYETVTRMNWTSGNKRMILVLGDAPSQVDAKSTYTLDDVVAVCEVGGVQVNLYPVLIDITSGNSNFTMRDGAWVVNSGNSNSSGEVRPEGLISSLYPNPAVDVSILQFVTWGDYRVEIYTITGSLVLDVTFTGDTYSIDCSKLPSGQYVLRASSPVSRQFDGKNLVVKH